MRQLWSVAAIVVPNLIYRDPDKKYSIFTDPVLNKFKVPLNVEGGGSSTWCTSATLGQPLAFSFYHMANTCRCSTIYGYHVWVLIVLSHVGLIGPATHTPTGYVSMATHPGPE